MTVHEFEIKQAYSRLSNALTDAHRITEELIKAKAAVTAATGEALLDGRIDGKNEAAREAQARRLFPDEYKQWDLTEMWVRDIRLWVEVQKLEVEEVRTRLRLAELTAQIAQAEAATE